MISTRLRIAAFFTLLTFATLTLFSSSVLYLYHQDWEQNEKMELHDVAEEFFKSIQETWKDDTEIREKEVSLVKETKDFFESQEKVQGKIWDMKGNVIFLSHGFPVHKEIPLNQYTVDSNSKNIFLKREIPLLGGYILFSENITEYLLQEETLLKISLILTLSGAVLLFVVGYLFAWKILAPLREISKKSHHISLEDLSHRLPIRGHKKDEMRVLSESLNEMFTRLENAAKNLKRFAQDASHELRTPLAIIDSTLQLSLKTKNFKKIEEAHEEIQRMHELLDSLLLLAKQENFRFSQKEKSKIMIRKSIENILKKIESHFLQKNISINIDIPDRAFFVAEEESLKCILWNLLWNALKFSPPHETIRVLYHRQTLLIENKGDIDSRDLASLFIPFFRTDNSKSSDGKGLGLAIAKSFIEANGGKIRVHNSNGKVIFEIEIP